MRDRITESFARQGLMVTLGATLDHIGDGIVRVVADVRPETAQQHGVGHAGLTFALADSAAGYAALTILSEGAEVVTSEFRISLLAPARGRLLAEGRVVRPGRRLVAVAADVWGGDDRGGRVHVATALGTMVPVGAG
ncbi:PaaI family thioesterase [Jannaschia sp. S6380]|uniref:PaaI family thioesterase n=1 Tax=Jannaschia sp. S6380 TaxID=2926408 RepID=UPI001FF39C3C|nr:PaaI family thioesterase [Jannaschia sp. S6380]MCK0169104.1 PaaI family thioesterase [Jannaschia sp. S6380]